MTEKEWSKLCRNIYEKKCILMIGSEFPVECKERSTSIFELLFEKLSSEILEFPDIPANFDKSFSHKDLCQLARDYILHSGNNRFNSRSDLEISISDCVDEITPEIKSESFNKLASLPFYFIVDTNYGNVFYELLKKAGKEPKKDFYNFKGGQVTISNPGSTKLGTEATPFVYNLYGSTEQPKSIAISDYDLIQLLNNIISKTPGLPADVRAELAHEETCILFIGFGILAKNWYFRILLHALTSGNKKTMSYALDYLSNTRYDEDPTILFFKDELNVCLYNYNATSFINELHTKYSAKYGAQVTPTTINTTTAAAADSVKIFISYKREDLPLVSALVKRMELNYALVLWDQSEAFKGGWADKLQEMIESADAFILMQSAGMKSAPVNYVNKEIRLAVERAKNFLREDSYLYPVYIDTKESILFGTDFKFIESIQNRDLSMVENVDTLCRDIIRNKERNRRINTN